jgi:hypothetical protein
MDAILWIGVWLFAVLFVVGGAWTRYSSLQFERHLERKHPAEWARFFGDQRKLFLWPFMRDTSVDLFWRSTETFGDPEVSGLRRRAKRAANVTVLCGLGIFVWGIVFGIVLPLLYAR